MNYTYVDTPAALQRACDEMAATLHGDQRVAVDTEFVGEQSYEPQLMLIQLAAPDGSILLIDAQRLRGQLAPLAALLNTDGLLKIMHAGGQDVPILHANLGELRGPWFDTQIAAAFVGYPLQTGYARLVEALLGVRLAKDATLGDWGRRPIPPRMLDYAADDVRHLHAAHARFSASLDKLGRAAWCAESVDDMVRSVTESVPQDELWRKIGRGARLEGREPAILRALCIWRDDEARRRNMPRRSVIRDEPLVAISRRAPQTAEAVLGMRAVPPNLGTRRAAEIAEVVKAALAVPPEAWPRPESTAPLLDDQGAARYDLLATVVRIRASEAAIAPALIASADPLKRLAASGVPADVARILPGWRDALIGGDLRAALAGDVSVTGTDESARLIFRGA